MGLLGLPSGLTLFDRTFAAPFTALLLLTRLICGFVPARFLSQYFRLIPVSQLTASKESIVRLASRFLTLYLQARRPMLELNRRGSFVDLLASAPASTNKSFFKICLIQSKLFQTSAQTFLFFLAYWRLHLKVLSPTYARPLRCPKLS